MNSEFGQSFHTFVAFCETATIFTWFVFLGFHGHRRHAFIAQWLHLIPQMMVNFSLRLTSFTALLQWMLIYTEFKCISILNSQLTQTTFTKQFLWQKLIDWKIGGIFFGQKFYDSYYIRSCVYICGFFAISQGKLIRWILNLNRINMVELACIPNCV